MSSVIETTGVEGASAALGLTSPHELEVAGEVGHAVILINCLRHTQMRRTFRVQDKHYA